MASLDTDRVPFVSRGTPHGPKHTLKHSSMLSSATARRAVPQGVNAGGAALHCKPMCGICHGVDGTNTERPTEEYDDDLDLDRNKNKHFLSFISISGNMLCFKLTPKLFLFSDPDAVAYAVVNRQAKLFDGVQKLNESHQFEKLVH